MHDGANFNSPLCPPLISSLFFCCEDLKRPRSYLYIKRGDPLIHLSYYLPSTWILLSSWSSLPSIVIIVHYRHRHRHSRRHLSSSYRAAFLLRTSRAAQTVPYARPWTFWIIIIFGWRGCMADGWHRAAFWWVTLFLPCQPSSCTVILSVFIPKWGLSCLLDTWSG
jgi:hypothetical protein